MNGARFNVDGMEQAARLFVGPGQIGEVRIIPNGDGKPPRGFFFTHDEIPEAVQLAEQHSRDAKGVYLIMNQIDRSVLDDRGTLQIRFSLTKNEDIVRRYWLLIDGDPKSPERTAEDSSTDEEKAESFETREEIYQYLGSMGFPEPVFCDSGNGAHMLYRIDLPNDDESTHLIRSLLLGLAAKFSTDKVDIDTKVFNAARITKAYGSVACKGENRPDRPHRESKIQTIPDGGPEVVSRELIIGAIASLPKVTVPSEERKPSEKREPVKQSGTRDQKLKRLAAYLANVPGAISGQSGHDNTFITALKAVAFGLDAEDTFNELLVWNEKCDPPWSEHELRHKLDDAIKADPEPMEDRPRPNTNLGGLVDIDSVKAAPIPEVYDPQIPAHLLNPGGLLQMLIDFNRNTAIKPQPELALAGAIALVGAVTGRKVQDDFGTRPNCYIVGIAPSGSGKDHARRVNKLALVQTGGDQMFQDDLASDAGLHVALNVSPSTLVQLDEFGRFLAATGNPAKAPWLYKIITVLMKLYSSSGDVYAGPSYADAKRNVRIPFPNCVLYATTVPASFFNALTLESLSDGFFNRLLIFEASNGDPDPQVPASFELPYSIDETIRWWLQYPGAGPLVTNMVPTARRLVATEAANQIFAETSQTVRERQRAEESRGTQIWGRCFENGRKLALIHQCSLDHQATTISVESAKWGCELALHLTNRIDLLAREHISDGEFDALAKKLLRFVREAGDDGRTRTEVCRHLRALNNRQIDEVVQKLESTEELLSGTRSTTGRAITVYKAIG